tara:strand:- start:408 stop:1022 length:615 start_codon:yes stop_codon:yes gene_type:complete
MRLERASSKAIKFACIKFHYAKSIPITEIAYSVFNKKNEWCGVICFGQGANANLGKKYGVISGQFLELTRMALNGKQESTSKAMAIAIKLIKKHRPLVKILISYADKGQKHYGIIYQATNWYFVEENKSSGIEYFYKGKWVHSRVPNTLPKNKRDKLKKRKKTGKYKYIYPINKNLIPMCENNSKTYPKKLSDKVSPTAIPNLE